VISFSELAIVHLFHFGCSFIDILKKEQRQQQLQQQKQQQQQQQAQKPIAGVTLLFQILLPFTVK